MAYRKRKNHKTYARFTKQAKTRDCDFCNFTPSHEHVVKSTPYFWVTKNIFPYDVWDISGVKDHLMIVPKRHVDTISHFTLKEQAAYAKLLGQYDQKGYSVYARAPGNVIKSVVHHHTHLIATDNKPKRFIVYLNRPRLVLFK